MSLPKWIDRKEMPCPHCGQNLNLPARTTEALVIAMEALEKVKSVYMPFEKDLFGLTPRELSAEALYRIRALGGEE